MNSEQLNFICNNTKGLQDKGKRMKVFEYLKNHIHSNGFVFLQEIHSSQSDEKVWRDDFKGKLFFSHGRTNSCGVAIGYYGSKSFTLLKKLTDQSGRILVLEVSVNDDVYVLANLYNPNTESEQLLTLSQLTNFLEEIDDIRSKKIILGGDFNFFLDTKLEAKGGKPVLKKHSIAKIIEIRDISRIRNPNLKRFTFRQNHFSGYIQRRLDFFFISNTLQEATKLTDILAVFYTDHSPVTFKVSKLNHLTKGNGLWKFNNSLTSNKDYIEKMKKHIAFTLEVCDKESICNAQVKWEYLKYQIRKFTIDYSKEHAKQLRLERTQLEDKLKHFEKTITLDLNENEEYNECKSKQEDIYQIKVDGIRTRSKCNWYEHGEKSSKFFLNLEKQRAIQSQIRTVIVNEKEITSESEINEQISLFYKSHFHENLSFSKTDLQNYLKTVSNPVLPKEQQDSCEGEITEKELLKALKSMENDKLPGNDGLSKEFYETFWTDIKTFFISSIKKSKEIKELCPSQRQAVIKLIEKKGRDKRFIKNWRPISLLNVDTKLISKVLSERIKNVLPSIISENQTAYVKNRFISEGRRLIDDLSEFCDTFKKEGFLVTIDIEKAFDSVNHNFLIATLEKFGFGKTFIQWSKIFLKNQESCIINAGKTSKYFELERGTRQGDPISAYLFILVLEVVFLSIKALFLQYFQYIPQLIYLLNFCTYTFYSLNTH